MCLIKLPPVGAEGFQRGVSQVGTAAFDGVGVEAGITHQLHHF